MFNPFPRMIVISKINFLLVKKKSRTTEVSEFSQILYQIFGIDAPIVRAIRRKVDLYRVRVKV